MRLRFVTWNVNGFAERGQAEFLAASEWDVCAVQEATTPAALERLATQVGATSYVSARPSLVGADDTRPRYVSALLARSPWSLSGARVLDVPSPERALHAVAAAGTQSIVVASMALPPASSRAWGPAAKVAQAEAIATWLAETGVPTIVGIDANTPKVDHPELARSVWWNAGEERLLGVDRIHRLRDVYREVVERDAALSASTVASRPDGPLAVSYRRGRGVRAVDCRYDVILVSSDIAVCSGGYEYEVAVAAGSDHALVWAELEVAA
jgi:endonuclease/exonuclease/phosphatase family metal-dependent hydrolase